MNENELTSIKIFLVVGLFLSVRFCGYSQIIVKVLETVKIHESHTYGFFPSLQMLSTGELICDLSLDADKDEVETNFWAYVISKDKGKTWGMRNTAGLVFREAAYTRNPSLADGTLLMLAGITLAPEGDFRRLQAVSIQFSDAGKTVKFSRDVHVLLPIATTREQIIEDPFSCASLNGAKIHECGSLSFCGTLVRDHDGGWLDTMYGKLEGDRFFRTIIVKSDKGGKNWRYVTTIAGDAAADISLKSEHEETSEGFAEPRMVRLADDRLFVVMRRGSNNMIYKSWSGDDGQTWTKPASIGFRGVKPNLWLMNNGVLALCTGRPDPLVVRFTIDGGSTWTNATALMGSMGADHLRSPTGRVKSTCYTGMAEVEPNKLLIVYDYLPFVDGWGTNSANDSKAMNTIYGTFVSVVR